MFENIRNKISKKDPDDLAKDVEADIMKLGDKGVECALRKERIPTELAMDRLDSLRIKGEELKYEFVVRSASRQLDRIMEAKKEW